MIRTTYVESGSAPVTMVPYLHPREIDAVLDAIDDGDLIALCEPGKGIASGSIVALATPDMAATITKRDNDVIKELTRELTDAKRELDSLKTIIGEVFAEAHPVDHIWKLEEAHYDVERCLKYAIDMTENL